MGHYQEMCAMIDPLRPSDSYGIDIFVQTTSFIARWAGARYEAEQSLSTNMATVTVCFLEKTGTEFSAC